MNMAHKIIAMTVACLVAGCASTSPITAAQNAARANSCLDPTRQVLEFDIQSDRQLTVNYMGGKTYRVILRRACPGLLEAEQVSFATGPDRYVAQNSASVVYATPIDYAPVCGRASERIVLRDRSPEFSVPSRGCGIQSIERIDEAVYSKIE